MARRFTCLLIFAAMMAAGIGEARAEKYALLIGINDYQFYGPTSDPERKYPPYDLFGCVNDIVLTKKYLLSQGFKESNIVTLTDLKATKANMTAAMKAFAAKVKPGDVAYFHFSGHGFQVQSKDPGETDAQDEMLACADYNGDPFAKGDSTGAAGALRDDDVGKFIASVNTAKKTFVFDCCHSGTISRALSIRSRSLPPVTIPRGISVGARSLEQMPRRSSFGDGVSRATPAQRSGTDSFVVVSACKDEQTAADDGTYGLMTKNLLATYQKVGPDAPIPNIVQTAGRKLAALGVNQDPQFTLGGAYEANPARSALKTLLADQPQAQNTAPKPPAAQVIPDPPLPDKVVLKIIGMNELKPQFRSAIASLSFVQLGESGESRALVRDEEGRITLRTADDVEIADCTAESPPEILRKANPYLIQSYLLRKLAILDNPQSQFDVSVKLMKPEDGTARNLKVVASAGGDSVDTGRPTIHPGEKVVFGITVDKPAYITLIDVGTDGSVSVLYPNRFHTMSQKAQPGQVYRFPAEGMGFEIEVHPPFGTEMVLAIATAKPLDLSQFNPETLPTFGGARSIGESKSVDLARNARNLVVMAAGDSGGGGASGWGTAILLANVMERAQ